MIEKLLARFPALVRIPHPAWAVGGAIRDLILGREPADVDIVCHDVDRCARSLEQRIIRLGHDRFHALRVVIGDRLYDFTVLAGDGIGDDLARRDFTVNAIAVDLATGDVIDPFGGRADIAARIVRMVRPENFDDDPLRTLKAVRMEVTLRFDIDEATLAAIRQRAASITRVAAERVTYELSAILSARALRRAVELLRRTRLDVPLLGREAEVVFGSDDVSLAGAFGLLVDDPRHYAERWRWSESLLRQVVALKELLMICTDLRIALYDAGETVSRQLPSLLRALGRDDDAARAEMLITPELFATKPLLSGSEIASITQTVPGPELGRRKRSLLEAQIRGEVRTHDEAESFVAAYNPD